LLAALKLPAKMLRSIPKAWSKRLLLWSAAVGAGRLFFLLDWNAAAVLLVLLRYSFFPSFVIRASHSSRGRRVVSPGDGRVCGDGGGVRGASWEAHQHLSRGLERARESRAGRWHNHENGVPAGEIYAAMRERASVENEQNVFTLSTDAGKWCSSRLRADCAKSSLVEEQGIGASRRRIDWCGLARAWMCGCQRCGDPGEAGAEREGRIERAGSVDGKAAIRSSAEAIAAETDANLTASGKRCDHARRRATGMRFSTGASRTQNCGGDFSDSARSVANLLCGYYAIVRHWPSTG